MAQKWTKTSFVFDSDEKFYAEFNDANPRAVKMFCKKLYPKKALQKNQKWPKIRKKTLLYIKIEVYHASFLCKISS